MQNKTMTTAMLKSALRLGFILTLAALSACAATSTASKTDTIIPERSQARWDALLSGDLETAYTYYSPGYRSTMSVVDFGVSVRLRRVTWTSAEYLDHSCDENRCDVKVKIGYKVVKAVPGMDEFHSTNVRNETWVKTDGEWWFLPKK